MASSKSLLVSLLFLSFFFLFTTFAAAEPCANHRFDQGKTFASCTDLPSLNFSLHWNYHSPSHTVDIAIRHGGVDKEKPPSTWMAWAINPNSKGMVGSQTLVAFQRDDGTMAAYTSPITSYGTQLQQGNLTFPVNGLSSVVNDNEMIIFATLTLPENTTAVNHLWQEGPLVRNVPGIHRLSGSNVGSMGTLDFLSGKIVLDKTRSSRNKVKIVHGVLCTFGWGFLIPIGALVARPPKEDKKRIYFNVFHYLIGYGCIGLSIANVFLGFNLVHLKVRAWPQLTYIVAILFLVCIVAPILEVVACRKRMKPSKTPMEKENQLV
ncbi:hypothetical protein CCACVL1_06255 [Corchorus capsularis]|uniref:DOMON domain-containing protein n=1 Tax=Corchorus capsularis TaxID=210143 RepID=A0A1R3JGG0_COCAP|nr:hypothetical protein CCACVL1_06255 [Corchorus capsularis]